MYAVRCVTSTDVYGKDHRVVRSRGVVPHGGPNKRKTLYNEEKASSENGISCGEMESFSGPRLLLVVVELTLKCIDLCMNTQESDGIFNFRSDFVSNG